MDSNGFSNVQSDEGQERQLKQSKLSYTREFLISLSGLEVCKRLPDGFNRSLLRDFEDVPHASQDRSRLPGRLPLQAPCRNGYSSSPPGKGEIGNSPRGLYRWDSRTSERSDILSRPDKDADSWRRHGNQYRRPGQDSKQDGLLGSGSFVERPRYGPGASAPRFRASHQHQLSRSNDPYHPPRRCKVGPHLQRGNNDSCNDETFGFIESASEVMVEEERKRRAEFEMVRNEQQKELQGQLKLKSGDMLKDDPMSDLAAPSDSRDVKTANGLGETVMKQIQQNGSHKISVSSQGQPSRPCVPPGFANTAVQKISAPKFHGHSDRVQVEMRKHGDGDQDEESVQRLGLVECYAEITSLSDPKGGQSVDLSSACKSMQASFPEDQTSKGFNDANVSCILEKLESMPRCTGNVARHKVVGEAGRSTSILEKLFGDIVSMNVGDGSNNVEAQNTKTSDVGDSEHFHSSIVGERSGSAPETTVHKIMPPEYNLVKLVCVPSTKPGLSEPFYNDNIPETISTVLTCEDLEQSFLSEIAGSNSDSQPSCEIYGSYETKTEMPNSDIDDNASLHLLSLLQKGISSNSKMTARQIPQIGGSVETQGNARDACAENLNGDEKELTLQTVFGAEFMKELQSFDAPLSMQQHSERAQPREEASKMPSKMETNLGALGRPTDIRLPEDHILIGLNDPRSSNGQDVPPFLHCYSDMTNPEFPYTELNAYSSSQFDQWRPMFHPFDPRVPLEGIMFHDDQSRNRFPANLGRSTYPRPNSRLHELDHPGFPITQQIHSSNNVPVTHLLPGFPSSPGFPPHFRMNHPGYSQLRNPDQGLSFGQRQANLASLGMHLQGRDHGGISSNGSPELFNRNLEMEIRSTLKPMQPFFHAPALYGHELDAGVWRR